MFSLAIFLVIMSGLLHAVWNLLAKRSVNHVVFLWSFQWVAVVVYLPWALAAIGRHPVPMRGWMLLGLTAGVHGTYVLLLANMYSLGDLSQVYPLMRGVSPIMVPVLGVVLLGERLSAPGWLGVGAVIAGIGMLGDWRRPMASKSPRSLSQATWLAIGVGLSIAAYTTLDKVTLRDVPAVALNDGSNLGNLIALSWWAMRSRVIQIEWAAHWKTIIMAGIVSPGGYLLFLTALQMAPVARLAPMREIGTVIATILGIVVLKEPQGWRRMVASGLITVGVILLATQG
ncbi:MAG: DMT family transporter [Firmicutes bacterium]|nr:DMT family transporter [Bacillota bacterium]